VVVDSSVVFESNNSIRPW